MSDSIPNGATRRVLRIKIALAVSVALNLLVVGFVVGALARQGGHGPWSARPPALANFGAPYVMALPKEDRRALNAALRVGGELPDRRMRRAMFEDVVARIAADPFDPAALQVAVRNQADISIAVQRRLQEAWLSRISEMTDEERQAYAAQVAHLLRNRGR